jgi:hypothetical protein
MVSGFLVKRTYLLQTSGPAAVRLSDSSAGDGASVQARLGPAKPVTTYQLVTQAENPSHKANCDHKWSLVTIICASLRIGSPASWPTKWQVPSRICQLERSICQAEPVIADSDPHIRGWRMGCILAKIRVNTPRKVLPHGCSYLCCTSSSRREGHLPYLHG